MTEPAKRSRRDRVRAATEEEIRATARALLVAEGPEAMTLRAIARDMGMTAPALYRYVKSHRVLVALVTVDCYDELISVMTGARDQRPSDDLAGRLMAVSRAFRRWALEHPREFGLVFTNPMTHLLTQSEDVVEAAAQRFGLVFGELFASVLSRYGTRLPERGEIPPAYVAELEAVDPEKVADMPLGARYLFLSAWVRLYGCVCMEVFGHLAWAVQDTEPVFEEALRDCATLIGIADEYKRSR
ncbi:MAG: TetR/AcrR family transcriptional regulator [Propionibacteriales bacterium]|nr:TetR/AcrR family transcriptional regulator [Propionibacteriales bacterium]